ncbi:MAG: hypothetical protein AVDCRST_MAG42-1779, partial [uncultured Chthoniobacterales bacterium]
CSRSRSPRTFRRRGGVLPIIRGPPASRRNGCSTQPWRLAAAGTVAGAREGSTHVARAP